MFMQVFYEPQFYLLALMALATSALTIYSVVKAKGAHTYLCQDCKFNNPKDCLKQERPQALECTSYRKKNVVSTTKK